MNPSPAELDRLRAQHGSIDRVAAAVGKTRAQVRNWYANDRPRHLKAVPDTLSSDHSGIDEIPVIVRDYTNHPHLYVYPLGDVHLGGQRHDRERWGEWLSWLRTAKHVSMLGTGDFLNCAIIGEKSDVYDETLTVGKAKRRLRDQLRPLAEKGRLDGLCPGNHEDRVTRATGDCPIEDVCDQLGVNYFEAAALFVYLVGDERYTMYVRHGTGNGQSLATLEKGWAVVPEADLCITGHTHQQAARASDTFRMDWDGMKLRRRHRYSVSSGSFLGLEKYAAQRGYAPTRLGAPRIYLAGDRHDVHVSI